MAGTCRPGKFRACIGACVLAALVIAAVLIAVFSSGAPVAHADDSGMQGASLTLAVSAEPFEVEFEVIGEYIVGMSPGDTSTLKVRISNPTSQAYRIVLEINPNPANSPDVNSPVWIAAHWDDGTLYHPGEIIAVGPNEIMGLTIEIVALDGAGTEEIQILVHRLFSEFI